MTSLVLINKQQLSATEQRDKSLERGLYSSKSVKEWLKAYGRNRNTEKNSLAPQCPH